MRTLEERINRGKKAILEARGSGKNTTDWEKHLLKLESQLEDFKQIQRITLPDFASRNLAIQIYSEFLKCKLWLCSNVTMAEQIQNDDPSTVTYTADELIELIKASPNIEDLKRIHRVKTVFISSRIIEAKNCS